MLEAIAIGGLVLLGIAALLGFAFLVILANGMSR